MKKYIVKSSLNAITKQLSVAQRTSSLFSEAPLIAGKILRRGVSIALEEAQYLLFKSRLDAMVKAGAITVTVVGDEGKVTASVTINPAEALSEPKVSGKVTPPEEGIISPAAKEAVPELVNEVVADVSAAVTESAPPPQDPPAEPSKRGRKPNQPK